MIEQLHSKQLVSLHTKCSEIIQFAYPTKLSFLSFPFLSFNSVAIRNVHILLYILVHNDVYCLMIGFTFHSDRCKFSNIHEELKWKVICFCNTHNIHFIDVQYGYVREIA